MTDEFKEVKENAKITALLTKLHKIMKSVERIEKDAKNLHQNYSYASEKIIKEVMHKEFVNNKVLFQLETGNPTIEGKVTFIACRYTFHDTETGQKLSGTFTGSGQARDEKGHYAAVTGAIKYILTSVFLIPTGDDPELDEAPDYKMKLARLLKKKNIDKPQVYLQENYPDQYIVEDWETIFNKESKK